MTTEDMTTEAAPPVASAPRPELAAEEATSPLEIVTAAPSTISSEADIVLGMAVKGGALSPGDWHLNAVDVIDVEDWKLARPQDSPENSVRKRRGHQDRSLPMTPTLAEMFPGPPPSTANRRSFQIGVGAQVGVDFDDHDRIFFGRNRGRGNRNNNNNQGYGQEQQQQQQKGQRGNRPQRGNRGNRFPSIPFLGGNMPGGFLRGSNRVRNMSR